MVGAGRQVPPIFAQNSNVSYLAYDQVPYAPTGGPQCDAVSADGQFPLCLARNANQNDPAHNWVPMLPMRPGMIPSAAAAHSVATNASQSRTVPVLRSAPKFSPIAKMAKAGRSLFGPLGIPLAVAASYSLEELNELLGQIDKTGGFIGGECQLTSPYGNAGSMLIFELTAQDLETGQRKAILSLPASVNVSNPLGAGGFTSGYTISTDRERQGPAWGLQAQAGAKGKEKGGSFGNSPTMGETFGAYQVSRWRGFVGPEVWRGDYVTSMKQVPRLRTLLPPGLDVKCGLALMGRSPLLGVPAVQSALDGKHAVSDRVSNNRADHSNEFGEHPLWRVLQFVAQTFMH